jgi:hypothetical protein
MASIFIIFVGKYSSSTIKYGGSVMGNVYFKIQKTQKAATT